MWYINTENGEKYKVTVTYKNHSLYNEVRKNGFVIDEDNKLIRVMYGVQFKLPDNFERHIPVIKLTPNG